MVKKKEKNFDAFSTFVVGAILLILLVGFKFDLSVTGKTISAPFSSEMQLYGAERFYGSVSCEAQEVVAFIGPLKYKAEVFEGAYGLEVPFYVAGMSDETSISFYVNDELVAEVDYVPYDAVEVNIAC